ncbi:ATP-binding protein, partial [Bacillus sp. P2(2020)]|nr:ATP-binding protein [Calidifontibacillus erzurumensis]
MIELKEVCKVLHLAHVAERFEEIPFENKEQFIRDVLMLEVDARQTT